MLLVEITVAGINSVVPGCVSKNELKIGTRRRKRDFRMAFSTAILETYLSFFLWSISITRISHLQKRGSKNILINNRHLIKIKSNEGKAFIEQDTCQRKLI